MLPLGTVDRLRAIAKLAGVTFDDVVNVTLATEILRMREEQNGRSKKSANKKSNDRSSTKSRLAKRK